MNRRLLARVLAIGLVLGTTFWAAMALAAVAWDPYFASSSTVANLGASTRPFGIAAGDYDGDDNVDLVIGRTTGNVAFARVAGWLVFGSNRGGLAPGDTNVYIAEWR